MKSKIPSEMKKELNRKQPVFSDPNSEEAHLFTESLAEPKYAPGHFLKQIDTSFESFFYQRDYTLKNFNFYLQVLAQQYKDEDALKTLRKMETMGLKPDDQTYNQVMVALAKNRKIEQVELLEKEAREKYNLYPPSKNRYNALILAYCKSNRALDAEKVLKEMKKEGL